eukprot:TRINITY_DN14615_c0_g1_i1.p1 TRINITY_DN14615_c0_g1~~TRINITY_DN14615_c0_g1_i1.p1  ORF type:complete len:576 (+),score=53.82 TRINITY_DN14615_c0_g1_i1:36-1730(+)
MKQIRRARPFDPFTYPDHAAAQYIRELCSKHQSAKNYDGSGYEATRKVRQEVTRVLKLNSETGLKSSWAAIEWYRRTGMPSRVAEVIKICQSKGIGIPAAWQREQLITLAKLRGNPEEVKNLAKKLILKNPNLLNADTLHTVAGFMGVKQNDERLVKTYLNTLTALEIPIPIDLISGYSTDRNDFFEKSETYPIRAQRHAYQNLLRYNGDFPSHHHMDNFTFNSSTLTVATGSMDSVFRNVKRRMPSFDFTNIRHLLFSLALHRDAATASRVYNYFLKSFSRDAAPLALVEGTLQCYASQGDVRACFDIYYHRPFSKETAPMLWKLLEAVAVNLLWRCTGINDTSTLYTKISTEYKLEGPVFARAVTTHGVYLRQLTRPRWELLKNTMRNVRRWPVIIVNEFLTGCALEEVSEEFILDTFLKDLKKLDSSLTPLAVPLLVSMGVRVPRWLLDVEVSPSVAPYLPLDLMSELYCPNPLPITYLESLFLSELTLCPVPSIGPPTRLALSSYLAWLAEERGETMGLPVSMRSLAGWRCIDRYCHATGDYDVLFADGGSCLKLWMEVV